MTRRVDFRLVSTTTPTHSSPTRIPRQKEFTQKTLILTSMRIYNLFISFYHFLVWRKNCIAIFRKIDLRQANNKFNSFHPLYKYILAFLNPIVCKKKKHFFFTCFEKKMWFDILSLKYAQEMSSSFILYRPQLYLYTNVVRTTVPAYEKKSKQFSLLFLTSKTIQML